MTITIQDREEAMARWVSALTDGRGRTDAQKLAEEIVSYVVDLDAARQRLMILECAIHEAAELGHQRDPDGEGIFDALEDLRARAEIHATRLTKSTDDG